MFENLQLRNRRKPDPRTGWHRDTLERLCDGYQSVITNKAEGAFPKESNTITVEHYPVSKAIQAKAKKVLAALDAFEARVAVAKKESETAYQPYAEKIDEMSQEVKAILVFPVTTVAGLAAKVEFLKQDDFAEDVASNEGNALDNFMADILRIART